MRKIIVMAGLLLCIFLTTLFAQQAKSQKPQGDYEEEVLKKLDQILQNQAEQFEYLRFIKNKSAR